jgi:hypothetical protein
MHQPPHSAVIGNAARKLAPTRQTSSSVLPPTLTEAGPPQNWQARAARTVVVPCRAGRVQALETVSLGAECPTSWTGTSTTRPCELRRVIG